MSNPEHVDTLLKGGVDAWNAWRARNPSTKPDLSGAHLERAILRAAMLSGTNLAGAHLEDANLFAARLGEADLTGACLRGATLTESNLYGAILREAKLPYADLSNAQLLAADLTEAQLHGCNLEFANLAGATLRKANLTRANLVGCCIVGADVEDCIFLENYVFGVSVWKLRGKPGIQAGLIVTPPLTRAARYPHGLAPNSISVDSLDIAQFIHAILAGETLGKIIGAASSKVVLLLGRFTPERKPILDALKNALTARDYVPVIFDFEGSENRDFTETITLLARMARFIVADLTDASSVQQELQAIVPDVAIPVQPILVRGRPWSMFSDFRKYHWVLPIYSGTEREVLDAVDTAVIEPAERKWRELEQMRRQRQ